MLYFGVPHRAWYLWRESLVVTGPHSHWSPSYQCTLQRGWNPSSGFVSTACWEAATEDTGSNGHRRIPPAWWHCCLLCAVYFYWELPPTLESLLMNCSGCLSKWPQYRGGTLFVFLVWKASKILSGSSTFQRTTCWSFFLSQRSNTLETKPNGPFYSNVIPPIVQMLLPGSCFPAA